MDGILERRGDDLYDGDGDKIGSIEEIYLDADTDEPAWAVVQTGLLGTKRIFVPLRDATDERGQADRAATTRTRSRTRRRSPTTARSRRTRRPSCCATTGCRSSSRRRV